MPHFFMTFNELVQKDINIFLNPGEFSTEHTFDGQKLNCIVDDDKLSEQNLKNAIGTYKGNKLLHIARADLKGRPKNGARVEFDKKIYTVTDCVENDGIFTITLDINKAL